MPVSVLIDRVALFCWQTGIRPVNRAVINSAADLKAVRGVYWSDLCNIKCYIPNENVGSLVFKSS